MNYLVVRPRIEEGALKLIFVVGPVSEKPKSMFVVPKWDNWRVRDLWSSVCNHGMCSLWKINWSNCQYWCCVATSESEREYRLRSQGGSKGDRQRWGFQREHDGTDRKIGGLNKGWASCDQGEDGQSDGLSQWCWTTQEVVVLLWSRHPTGQICSPVPKTYKRQQSLKTHSPVPPVLTCLQMLRIQYHWTLWKDANITRKVHPTVQMLQHLWTLPRQPSRTGKWVLFWSSKAICHDHVLHLLWQLPLVRYLYILHQFPLTPMPVSPRWPHIRQSIRDSINIPSQQQLECLLLHLQRYTWTQSPNELRPHKQPYHTVP
jgi:hypothetical protein